MGAGSAVGCPACGARFDDAALKGYECPRCGHFLAALYRAEHRDPRRGRRLGLVDIRAEYRAAGMAVPAGLARQIARRRRGVVGVTA